MSYKPSLHRHQTLLHIIVPVFHMLCLCPIPPISEVISSAEAQEPTLLGHLGDLVVLPGNQLEEASTLL